MYSAKGIGKKKDRLENKKSFHIVGKDFML
jgi:hypothetical protein